MNKRKSRLITNKDDIEFLLNINPERDFNKTFMMETFGDINGKNRFNPYDLIRIPPGSYGSEKRKNKNTFTTTVGIWVYNKFFIEPNLFELFGYINEIVNKKVYGKIKQELTYAVMEDRLEVSAMKTFIVYNEFLMPFVSILSPNDTNEILTISTEVEPLKQKLIEENKEAISNGDIYAAAEMEEKLIDNAMEKLADDPSIDSYVSGARASIGNNFKNIYLMKGAIKDPITNEFNIATSNYVDGISPDEYHLFANSLAGGAYNRTNKTKDGGYWEKLFVAAFQHIKILPPGTDCGTDKYIEMYLKDPKAYMYSYMIEGDKLVQITSQNMDKYKDKKVKIRFSSMCKSKDGICSVCAGEMFHKLGMYNVGLALAVIPSKLKNYAMKAFHDSTQNLRDMDVEKAFGFSGTTKLHK